MTNHITTSESISYYILYLLLNSDTAALICLLFLEYINKHVSASGLLYLLFSLSGMVATLDSHLPSLTDLPTSHTPYHGLLYFTECVTTWHYIICCFFVVFPPWNISIMRTGTLSSSLL